MNDAKDAKKIAKKAELLVKQLGFTAAMADSFAGRVHMIKVADRPRRLHRIMCSDGSWAEIDPKTRRVVRTWGSGHTAREMAKAIAGDDSNAAEHLEETGGAISAPGAPVRSTPVLTDEKTKRLADGWRQRGYTDLMEDERGVWVALEDGTRLFDAGRRVHIHGPRTDAALAAIAQKARADWDGALALRGPGRDWPEVDKARLWLACRRQGVVYSGYEPNADLVARWEAERDETESGAAQALQPDDPAPASAGPVPPMTGDGSAVEPEPDAPPTPQPGVDEALARNAARAQADLDALLARWAKEARTEADRERLRQEEEVLKTKIGIYERARALAQAEGLSREEAIRAAYAEVQDRDQKPVAALRR